MTTMQAQPLILSVTEITQAVKLSLESTFGRVWVKGEVSNGKVHTSGHFYFSLKDEFAQITCVMFRGDMMKLAKAPKDGDKVLIRAEMSVYAARGNYQLVVRELSNVGIGEQLLKLEQLKQKLAKLGYFSPERKRPLPRFPKRIGVVTSPTGAVIQDILNVLGRRMRGFHLVLNPVRVQGEGADIEIAQAITQCNQYNLADVLIVGRGGGSAEDLAPFNSEIVATAIFQSQIPVVSAVGHETDFTIADLVADVRAATPSQAAEIISHEQSQLLEKLTKYAKDISFAVTKDLRTRSKEVARLIKHPIFAAAGYLLESRQQRLDDVVDELDTAIKRKVADLAQDLTRYKKSLEAVRPSAKIAERKQDLMQYAKNIHLALNRQLKAKRQLLLQQNDAINTAVRSRLVMKKRAFMVCQFQIVIPQLVQKMFHEKKRKIDNVAAQLESVNPKKVLAKGYSIIFSEKDSSVITSASTLAKSQKVKITFTDGEAIAEIINVRVHHDQ